MSVMKKQHFNTIKTRCRINATAKVNKLHHFEKCVDSALNIACCSGLKIEDREVVRSV